MVTQVSTNNALWGGPTLFTHSGQYHEKVDHMHYMLSANCSKLFWLNCRFGEYDLHDLVELDQMTAGVMIAADAETCQILTNRNAVSLPH